MKDLQVSISIACDPEETLRARHEAFAELVLRFQDMAFACSYAVLGDSYLAEDVAQEAFIVAWQKLDKLREPQAFPGWFKRIVLTQCHRLTRGKRLPVVPLDTGNATESDPGPHAAAEKQQLLTKVLSAIKALPDNERLVTTLFYVNGYTQADIGDFLELPVSTVNKRLYTARQRLKETVNVFKDDLKDRRPSRDQSFSERVSARLRPLVRQDWSRIQSIASARQQPDAAGNEWWLRRRQNFDETRYVRRQYVAEDPSKQMVGYGAIEQSIYLPKYRLFLVADPKLLCAGVGRILLTRLIADLNEAGAITVSCNEDLTQTELIQFLLNHRFEETDRMLDLRLDVAKVDHHSAHLEAVRYLREQGITISTLADERANDPRYVEKLYELVTAVRADDESRSHISPPAFHEREALLWLQMPYVLPNAYLIAKKAGRYIGVSDLSLFDAMPGGLTHGFTGVIREYRNRGIATALKLSLIGYAREHNYNSIQALNRSCQSRVLKLNQKLGYQVLSTRVTLEKCLKPIAKIDPQLYDDYAGRYRDDVTLPDVQMVVRREADALTIEAVGQKVQLFPTSESEFFVKQFYGEATFVRDPDRKVNMMKFVMPQRGDRKGSVQNARRIDQS